MALGIYDWSLTAADNDDADSTINWLEGQLPGTVNGSARAMMKRLAELLDDLGAVNTVTGTNTIAVTVSGQFTAYATGMMLRFVAANSISGAATLNVTPSGGSAIGAKKIRKISAGVDVDVSTGDIVAGETYTVIYRAAADSATGAWVLIGAAAVAAATTTSSGIVELATPAETATGTDATRSVTPDGLASLWQKGANVASAGTITLDDGGFFHITGTTTITDIDWTTATDGRGAWLEFDGALTLTHNATTLNLPGGANITTEAGDRAYVVQDSSDNVHVMTYIRASGNLTTSTGSAPAYAARAWVNFNGTGTVAIRASGNVSSITDNGTGDYTVNFTTAMPDASYGFGLGYIPDSQNPASNPRVFVATSVVAGSIRVLGYAGPSGSALDYGTVSVSCFR